MPANTFQSVFMDELLRSPIGQKLHQAMDMLSDIQLNLYALKNSEDSTNLKLLKIGTVFHILLIDILVSGKKPHEITRDEWEGIASKVSQYAIMEDGQSYSEFVFTAFASFIAVSATAFPFSANEAHLSSIINLSNSIHDLTLSLHNGTITEVTYIEECLWTCLEAMFKLISVSLSTSIGSEHSALANAVSMLAFEYGRYMLYSKQEALLAEYIDYQRTLDDQLRDKYEAYLAELQSYAEEFQALLGNAFSPDFRNSLIHSVELARAAGVNDDEILKSIEEIDDYFLS